MALRFSVLTTIGLVAAGCATVPRGPADVCPEVSVSPEVQLEFYVIEGADPTELRAQMRELGPRDIRGVHHGYAQWHVDWRYPFLTTSRGCATGTTQVTVKTKYTLPRWHDEASAPPELRARWRCFLSALLVHEDGHRLHARDAAATIEALLPRLPPQPSCAEMDNLANAEAHRILEHFRELDQEYDRETRHGMTQGAVFR